MYSSIKLGIFSACVIILHFKQDVAPRSL